VRGSFRFKGDRKGRPYYTWACHADPVYRCIVGATLAVALAPCSSEVFFDSRYKVYGVAGAASSIYKLAMKQKYIFFKKDGM